LKVETEILMTASRLSEPVAVRKSKFVVRLQILTVSQQREASVRVLVPRNIMTGLTVPSLSVVSLHEKVQSVRTRSAPTGVMVTPSVKVIALIAKGSVRIVLVKPRTVTKPRVSTDRSVSIFE
jgi:hypothetical protein